MKYVRKVPVDAMQWIDTDDYRMLYADWLDEYDLEFSTVGSTLILPDVNVEPGEWVLILDDLTHGEPSVLVMADVWFRRSFDVCTKTCGVTGCSCGCVLAPGHEGRCACARKLAALRSVGITGPWVPEPC